MSLSTIGALSKDVSNIGDFTSKLEVLKNLGTSGADSFNNISNSLKNLSADAAVEKLNKLNLNPQLSKEILDNANNANILSATAEEVSSAMGDIGSSGAKGLSSLDSGISGIGNTLMGLMQTPLGLATVVAGGTMAVFAAIDYFTTNYSEALQDAQNAAQNYANTKSDLSSLNNEYQTNLDRIQQLQALKNSGTISSSENAELSNLLAQNQAIETQINSKEKLLEVEQQDVNKTAKTSLEKADVGLAGLYDDEGKKYAKGSKQYDLHSESLTDAEAIQASIDKVDEFQGKIDKLKKKQKNAKSDSQFKEYQEDIDQYQSAINDLETDMGTRAENISGTIANMTDKSSKAYKDAQKALNEYNTRGMSEKEKSSKSIETFLNSRTTDALGTHFTDLAKAGKLTKDSITDLGLDAKSFGVDNLSTVIDYFNDLAGAADNAADSVEKVDGTFSGISQAFQTENAGDAYEDTGNYLQKAKEQFDKGLINTDDVKSVAKMIGVNPGEIKDKFAEKYQEAMKYFTFDDNGNMTEEGVITFMDEYKAKLESINGSFKTSAEAASAMNMTAEEFEILMGRAQDHDMDFGDMEKSSEQLESAKMALASLKDLYKDEEAPEGMEDQIERWEEALANTDLTKLDPTILARIEFTYDLESLQQSIDDAKAIAENGGDASDWAEVLANQEHYRDTAEEELGFDKEGFEAPEEYQGLTDSLAEMQKQLSDLKGEDKTDLQEQMSSLYDIQNGLLESFAMENPDINEDTSPEVLNEAWENFMDNVSLNELVADLDINDEEAIQKISELFGVSEESIIMTIKAEDEATETVNSVSEKEIQDKIVSLIGKDNATPYLNLWNYMSMDPKFSSLSAQDQASLVVDTYNGLSLDDKNALISEDGGSITQSTANSVANALNAIPPKKKSIITVVKNTISKVISFLSTHGNATTKAQDAGLTEANGTAHSNGTALWQYRHSGSHAYGGGNWGLRQSERALINELGSEIIVRNGRWFTLNNGYPTMADLKAGDIIFNHRQSEALLSRGYVTGSHARMVGSSYAEGSLGHLAGRAYASGTDFKQEFDQIEILIDRMESAFKRISDSIETLSYNLTAQNKQVDSAISKAKSNLSSYQKAYNAYMSKANSVGLSGTWVNAVKNGSYNLSEITDEKLKDKIDDYKKYYEKALGIQKDIADLQKELVDLAMKKLSNIDSYFSNRFDYNDDFGYANQISELKSALSQYQSELSRQVSSGTIKQYSDEWYDAQKKIADYTQKILDATWKKFEDTLDHLDRASDNLKDFLSLKEAKGEPVTEAEYQKQIDLNNAAIQKSYDLRGQLVKKQAVYDVGSKLYDSLAKEISGLDSDIYDLMENNEKLKKSIWETRFTNPFEEVIDGIDETISSSKNLRSLLDKDSFFDERGILTDNGLANLALLGQEMAASKQKVAEYTTALKKLDEAYKNGILNQEDYHKSQKNMLKDIQDAAGDVQDYKDKIIDLYKDQMKAEIDYMDDYYDKRQKALDLDKKYYDFSKKLNDRTKSVNQLKAQISALQGVNNASAQAELRRLEQELAEKEEDLAELKKDHADDMIDRGYDKLSSGMKDSLDSTMEELTYNADMQEQVVADMLNKVVAMYGQAYGKINEIIANTGFAGNSGFHQNITDLGTQSGAEGQAAAGSAAQSDVHASGVVSGVNTGAINQNPSHDAILEDISKETDINNRLVAELTLSTASLSLTAGKSAVVSARIRPTDAANKTLRWTSSNTKAATVSGGTIKAVKAGSAVITCSTTDGSGLRASVSVSVAPAPAKAPAASQSNQAYGGIPFRYKKDYYPKNKLNVSSSIVDRLKSHDFDSSMAACRDLYNYWGGGDYYSGTYAQNVWLLSKMRSAGYRRGTRSVPISGPDFIHEGEIVIRKSDGGILVPLERGDGVIPSGLTENLWDLAERAPQLLGGAGLYLPSPAAAHQTTRDYTMNAEFNFGTLLNIEGNADKDIVDELRSALPSLGKELTQIVSSELSDDYRKLK